MNKLISMIPILTGGGNLQTQKERERERQVVSVDYMI